MRSTRIKKQGFTMEDFEKGLMLAGIITPSSINELHEKELLDEYESSLEKSSARVDNLFFKRVTLAAEIVSQMHNEPTFGRVKFQKLMYLCENAASMDLNERYLKQAAGPFDNKFMHSIVNQFKKNKWFDVEIKQDGKYRRSVYIPLDNADDFKKYYHSYFVKENDKIQYILDLFRKVKTDNAEIAATLYACNLELSNENNEFSEDSLFEKFYQWSEAKSRFRVETVSAIWKWMKEKNIIL